MSARRPSEVIEDHALLQTVMQGTDMPCHTDQSPGAFLRALQRFRFSPTR